MASTRRQSRPAAWLARAAWGVLLCACSEQTHLVGSVDPDLSDARDRAGRAGAPSAAPTASAGAAGQTRSPVDAGQDVPAPLPIDAPLPPAVAGPDGCVFETAPAMARRLDMYLMVDGVITQPLTGRWDNVRLGISGYVGDPRAAGTGVGVRVFGLECTANSYAIPDAPVELLPGNAGAIRDALPRIPLNASPMLPALQGAIMHAQSRAGWYPDHRQIVVMVTDGFPDTCLASNAEAPAVAAQAFAGSATTPSIPTYVIAVREPRAFNPFDPLAELGLQEDELDRLAVAGGTEVARSSHVDEPPQTLTDALLEIQHDAQPCEYAVPADVDTARWTLAIDTGIDPPNILARVEGAQQCLDGGYYLDASDAQMWAVVCPTSCSELKASASRMLALTGCEG